jgi:hypothetical protein
MDDRDVAAAGDTERASALLDVTNEAELDEFLHNLVADVTRSTGSGVQPGVNTALVDHFRQIAQRALPTLSAALAPRRALSALPAASGTATVNVFGLELEGMSPEDRDYETARQFVRFARTAIGEATRPGGRPTRVDAAIARAARKFAPGLLRSGTLPPPDPHSGLWVRAGNTIVLLEPQAYRL